MKLPITSLAGVERGDRNITLQTLEKITAGLEINAKDLFELDSPMKQLSIETEQLVHMFAEQLKLKSDIEVKLIIDLANKIFETYSKIKTTLPKGGLLYGYKPFITGWRLKALAFIHSRLYLPLPLLLPLEGLFVLLATL